MPNGVPPQSDTGYATLPDGTRVPTVKPPGNVTWDDTRGWISAPQGDPNEHFTSYEDALARWTYTQKVAQFGTKVPAPPGWKPSPMPEGWGGSKPQGYGVPSPGAPPQPAPSPSNTVAPLGAPPVTSNPTPSAGPQTTMSAVPGYSGPMQNQLRPPGQNPYQTSVTAPKTTMQAAGPEQPTPEAPGARLPWAPTSGGSGEWQFRDGSGARTANLATNIVPGSMTTMQVAAPGSTPPTTPTGGPMDWAKLSRALAPMAGGASAGPSFGFNAFGGQAPKDTQNGGGYARQPGAPAIDLASLLSGQNNPFDLSKLRGAMADPNATMMTNLNGGRGRGY